jgi:hypothetical protein
MTVLTDEQRKRARVLTDEQRTAAIQSEQHRPARLARADEEPDLRTPEQLADADEYLTKTDDVILACRGQGHAWPKLRTGRKAKPLPKGITARKWYDGSWQITSTCLDCGMERTLTTRPGDGLLDYPAQYRYVQPEGYASPKGSGITRRDALSESWRRVLDVIGSQPAEGVAP